VTRFAAERARLREQAEHHLRVAAMEDLRRRHPQATTAPHRPPGGYFWRLVFVPLYRRVPWEAKQKAMRALRMTAASLKALQFADAVVRGASAPG
jgi:3-polyprenyl-4-hydroxybenzoate decarboxylase